MGRRVNMELSQIDDIVKEIMERTLAQKHQDAACVKAEAVNEANAAKGAFDIKLASAMEHSMIRPDATPAMVRRFCGEAVRYGFRNVSLAPCFVPLAAELLKGTGVRVSTVICFPMGIASTETKVFETREVIAQGAKELDLPINVGMLKAGELKSVKADIEAVVKVAAGNALVKVVVDLGQLTEEEKIKAAIVAKLAGADFLKIAVTTRPVGVNAEDIRFFRQIVGPDMGLKADGGIKDYKAAKAVIEAGGTTIGASGSVK
ncbi:MAG TPA: deoxyribose-phosphate aldolase [Negativicutes bacterium]|nr:deoxyribose-phosphate aldolase [Negativicutes bacterium]